MKNHIALVHESSGKEFFCETCGNSYKSKTNLRLHIKSIHEGKKDHKCDACNKSYIDISSLKKHVRIFHEGRKDYICSECGKAFSV